jgi:hypothetical protein
VPRLDRLEDRTLPSTFTVHNLLDSGPGSLRQAILDANAHPGADLIHFTDPARGTLTLTSGPLTITDDLLVSGPGARALAVSGNAASRVFHLSRGVTALLANLTITRGQGDGGGGIWNEGGRLTLAAVVLSDNRALGSADARGGAILNTNAATLVVSDSQFTGNQALAGTGGNARGGAIHNEGAGTTLTVINTTFTGNAALGGNGGAGGPNALFIDEGYGGALSNEHGAALYVTGSTFTGNRAVGGNGGVGGGGSFSEVGLALGGAIYNNSSLSVSGSTFTGNQALGGSGGTGGSAFAYNVVGSGAGGAIMNTLAGTATVAGSTFTANQAIGGNGNRPGTGTFTPSGAGSGGAIGNGFGAFLALTDCALTNNQALGGSGNSGTAFVGFGFGGGIWNIGGLVEVTSSTLVGNVALGGAGGDGLGGGFFSDEQSEATFIDSTLTDNQALGGPGGQGRGGGAYVTDGAKVRAVNTLLFANFASTSDDDVFGALDRRP